MSVYPRFTSSDLELLPDREGVRYEIIDGELHVSKQPTLEHQYVCLNLGAELLLWNRRTGLGRAYGAPGLVFAGDDDVAPDLVWISLDRLAAARDSSGHLRAAPELAIEVLSPGSTNERRDRDLKLKLYSRQGVQEYWIVDWRVRTIQVFRRSDQMLQLVGTVGDGEILISPLLPGFELRPEVLWEPAP